TPLRHPLQTQCPLPRSLPPLALNLASACPLEPPRLLLARPNLCPPQPRLTQSPPPTPTTLPVRPNLTPPLPPPRPRAPNPRARPPQNRPKVRNQRMPLSPPKQWTSFSINSPRPRPPSPKVKSSTAASSPLRTLGLSLTSVENSKASCPP